MCYIWMAYAAVAVVSAMAAKKKAEADNEAAKVNAGIADRNANIADQQALDERRAGDERAAQIRRQSEQTAGRQRSTLAARGIDLTTGTASELQTQTDFFSTVDQDTAVANSRRAAWGRREQATNFRTQASALRSAAAANDPWEAALFGGMSQGGAVASAWYYSKK